MFAIYLSLFYNRFGTVTPVLRSLLLQRVYWHILNTTTHVALFEDPQNASPSSLALLRDRHTLSVKSSLAVTNIWGSRGLNATALTTSS